MGRDVHTLAQNGTTIKGISSKKPVSIVYGHGSDISTIETIFARNKRKIITQRIALSLVDIATKKGDWEMVKEYWNTYYCMNEIVSDGKRGFARYCKNRICAVCSGNRKADLINKYLPIVDSWGNPYFVTLTLKAVPAYKLPAIMRNMITGFQRIMDKHKKRERRGKGKKLIGIRSFECNFNPLKRTYNPHFHIIVPDKETAELLVKEWIYYCNKKGKFWASRKAQDLREIYDNVICLVEVIKYGSKIFTFREKDEKTENKTPPKIYIAALHNILSAMKGLRLFDSFGFRLPKKVKDKRFTILREYDVLKYDSSVFDWVDSESELRLSDYVLPAELQNILEGRIDKGLE